MTTGVLTPKYHALIEQKYDKFKFCFRIHGETKQLVGEIMSNFKDLRDRSSFRKIFIIAQDISHAKGCANLINKVAGSK